MRADEKRSWPRRAYVPTSASTTMCMAAASVPKRELRTPVARNSWKVSAGTRSEVEQERDGHVDAAEQADHPGAGEARVVGQARAAVSEYQAANSTKLSESSLAACGKL